jgi:2-keto-4-pentenoate hydratase/2-oxohepta-3-ene-1,7-dioic acid hydratase in catechol pathway
MTAPPSLRAQPRVAPAAAAAARHSCLCVLRPRPAPPAPAPCRTRPCAPAPLPPHCATAASPARPPPPGALAHAARETPKAAAASQTLDLSGLTNLLDAPKDALLALIPAIGGSDAFSPPAAPVASEADPASLQPRNLITLSIANADGSETLGVKTPAGVVDVAAASRALGLEAPLTMDALLREHSSDKLQKLVSAALEKKAGLVDESSITYGRLFKEPKKIVCVGLNFRKHAEESQMAPPRVPPLFNKYNNALAPHMATVKLPPSDVAYKIDYETELLVVMGANARNVSVEDALKYVAGYSIGHDLSARDLQLELPAGQWMLGKTLDGFAPIGPYFVSADLVGNPDDLKLETLVNGKVRQNWTTSDFIHDVPHVVSYVSKHFTLDAGDIIFTGTPQGVIHGYSPRAQHWLKAGDEIVSRIEKLGELKFKLA